jgi:mRNA interferase MazF
MYKKGTVILVPFPFTDLSGNKVRPAVIISKGKMGADIVVLFITSQAKLKEKYLVSIKPEAGNGLKVMSKIVCSKIATLDAKIILGELGTLSKSVQKQIDQELKIIFDL